MYCSNACKLRVWKERNPDAHMALRQKHEVPKMCAYFTGYCACGVALGNRRPLSGCAECAQERRAANAREAARVSAIGRDVRDRSARACKCCGTVFTPEYGNKRRTYCSGDCMAKAAKRVAKAARRARLSGVEHEPIDPVAVCERDGWTCQICGVETPRALRGTTHQQAPEMDHMVALALGGRHTMDNVCCLCRRCNGLKGALPLDEAIDLILAMTGG